MTTDAETELRADIAAYADEVVRFQADELAPAVFKARRVPRGIYEQRQNGHFMLRVRLTGGVLSAAQARKIAALARDYGNGTLHLTTRLDLQFHDLAIAQTPALMRELHTVGLTSRGGGGNTVRNVAVCPFAGVCPAEVFDVTNTAQAITDYLIALTGSYNLPRKYKIAASSCAADCARARISDLGFIAALRGGAPGFILYAGGGMGAQSRVADLLEEWLPARDAIRAAEAVRRLFDRFGDRQHRDRARLRFAVEKMGIAAFREAFRAEMRALAATVPEAPLPETVHAHHAAALSPAERTDAGTGLRVVDERADGIVTVPLPVPLGLLPAADLDRLADIAERCSAESGLRTTRRQGLLLRAVRREQLPEVAAALRALATPVTMPSPVCSFTSCAGAATCRLGLCLARNAARAAGEALAAAKLDPALLAELEFCISGCPNACGHHPVAALGFYGSALRVDNRLVPAYRVLAGGGADQAGARLATDAGIIPARALPALVVALVRDFAAGRAAGESFGAYAARRGLRHFAGLVASQQRVPAYGEAPENYRDWGQDADFSLAGRGAGECGAGVFEVIREDIGAAKRALAAAEAAAGDDAAWLAATVAAARSLLITRGIDTREPAGVLAAFMREFIDAGLAGDSFRVLVILAQEAVAGRPAALAARAAEIRALLARVELLFTTLDAGLVFHPPGTAVGAPAATAAAVTPAAAARLDLTGVLCPLNFVKAKLKLETLPPGAVLELILDAGEPVTNVPASLREQGQEIIATTAFDRDRWLVTVRRLA